MPEIVENPEVDPAEEKPKTKRKPDFFKTVLKVCKILVIGIPVGGFLLYLYFQVRGRAKSIVVEHVLGIGGAVFLGIGVLALLTPLLIIGVWGLIILIQGLILHIKSKKDKD